MLITNELRVKLLRLWQKGQCTTDEQEAFILDLNPELVLIAAAGSGKTRVLVRKFMREALLGHRSDLVVISHSKSAAATFSKRLEGEEVATTLHSWAKHRILAHCFGINEQRVSCIIPRALETLSAGRESACVRAFTAALLLFVDEGQDCAPEQFALLRLLVDIGAKLVMVADPRQAIYAFAGVEPRGVLEFSAHVKYLTVNFRCAEPVVHLANLLLDTETRVQKNGLEDLPPQVSKCAEPDGPVPELSYLTSFHPFQLMPIVQRLEDHKRADRALGEAGSAPVLLTYSNSDVRRLHQNLCMSQVTALAFFSQGNRHGSTAGAQQLPPHLDAPDVPHIRTIHSMKGEEADSVFLFIRGYSSHEEAARGFKKASAEDKEEELRRYYVAITRAKRRLLIFVVGYAAPVWIQCLMANAQDDPGCNSQGALRVHKPKSFPTAWQSAASSSEERVSCSAEALCYEYGAVDNILTHSRRGAPHNSMQGAADGDRNRSKLADRSQSLNPSYFMDAVRPQIDHLGVRQLMNAVLAHEATLHFAGPAVFDCAVREALDVVSRLPLETSKRNILRKLAFVTGASFYHELCGLLSDVLSAHTSQTFGALQLFLRTAYDQASRKHPDDDSLLSFDIFFYQTIGSLVRPHTARSKHLAWAYVLGPVDHAGVKLAHSRLCDLFSSEILLTVPHKTADALLLRPPIPIFDTAQCNSFRALLYMRSLDYLQERMKDGVHLAWACLLSLATAPDVERRNLFLQALPYLTAHAGGALYLPVAHLSVSDGARRNLGLQALELKDHLQGFGMSWTHRTVQANFPVSIELPDVNGACRSAAPSRLCSVLAIACYAPDEHTKAESQVEPVVERAEGGQSHVELYIHVDASDSLSITEECVALLSGSAACARYTCIWHLRTGWFHIYNTARDALDLLRAAVCTADIQSENGVGDEHVVSSSCAAARISRSRSPRRSPVQPA